MEKVKLTISQLLQDLEDGLTRKDIAKKYGLTQIAVSEMFKHPKLKGKKTKKPKDASFELVDDTDETPELIDDVKDVEEKPKQEKKEEPEKKEEIEDKEEPNTEEKVPVKKTWGE